MRSSTLLTPADAYRAALRGADCRVIAADAPGGVVADLDAWRWAADPNKSDHELLARCSGSTVDIGCGPGRMTAALMARGVAALGVDVVAEAVRQTNARGGMALERDVFSRLPGEGRWDTALLADGNIGIGGDPLTLLRRCRAVLRPGAVALVETSPDRGHDIRTTVTLHGLGGRRSHPVPWAVLGSAAVVDLAASAGFVAVEEWHVGGRAFVMLRHAG